LQRYKKFNTNTKKFKKTTKTMFLIICISGKKNILIVVKVVKYSLYALIIIWNYYQCENNMSVLQHVNQKMGLTH